MSLRNTIRVSFLLALAILPFAAKTANAEELQSSRTSADMVIDEATRYLGTPYRWGGKTPEGFDCAGFTRFVYSQFGISLAPSAAPQYKQGQAVKKSNIAKGDLVFYGGSKKTRAIGHVGIVTDVTPDGFSFIHASRSGVRISSSKEAYYSRRYIGACRVLNAVTSKTLRHVPKYDDSITRKNVRVEDTIITIAMVGDMMLGTTYPSNQLPANDGKNLFDDCKEILRHADIAVGNCEGAISKSTKCTKGKGKYSYAFRMPPSYAELFKDAGFDFLSLANNHSNDFNTEGIKETMKMLDSMNIKYAGVKGLCRSALMTRKGVKYGFCAFGHNSYTYRHQDIATVKEILKSLRDSCDILIVSFHGGAEGKDKTHLPEGKETFLGEDRGSLRSFAHMCIDEGADLVYGHGPHVCRAVEIYKGHFIAYSLGNFCTPAGINVSGISGYAPVITVRINRKGKVVDGRIHSFIQTYGKGPKSDAENKVSKSIRSLTNSDFVNPHIEISDDGTFLPK
ncbi:MAG: CapA family protein [Bacteroidales bacterium]|nr:CapA family protein [Bacteroidales bacterium]